MGLPDQILKQSWLHSHEEDKGDEMVFRPSTFMFPPSRGRQGFSLNPDGTASVTGPDATDRSASESAKWLMQTPSTLVLQGANQTHVLEITSASADKLTVKRIET
jgi:hypothetical protein